MNYETKYKTLEFSGHQSKLNIHEFPTRYKDAKDEKKSFFVFGKTTKQTEFKTNPLKMLKINSNTKSIDEFLEENPFSNTKEMRFINTTINLNQKERPHTSHSIKKKIWIESKNKKKFEKPTYSQVITMNEKNK
jgi:hypothetical protein